MKYLFRVLVVIFAILAFTFGAFLSVGVIFILIDALNIADLTAYIWGATAVIAILENILAIPLYIGVLRGK